MSERRDRALMRRAIDTTLSGLREDPWLAMRVLAKIRYNHKGGYCRIEKLPDGRVRALFESPVRAATPGQSICFYDGEYVCGGGIITGGYTA